MANREKCKFRILFRILHRGETASLIWSLEEELDSGGADKPKGLEPMKT